MGHGCCGLVVFKAASSSQFRLVGLPFAPRVEQAITKVDFLSPEPADLKLITYCNILFETTRYVCKILLIGECMHGPHFSLHMK